MKNAMSSRKLLAAIALTVFSITHSLLAYGEEEALLESGSQIRARTATASEVAPSDFVPGDDVEATNATIATNPPPPLASFDIKAAPTLKLLGASGDDKVKEYKYPATGDLRTWTSGSDITLYFDVTDHFIEIESATISLNAYDVDYPVATENDATFFNGTSLGWRLQGGNNSWHINNINVPNWLINYPREIGGSEQNQFFVDVDSGNEGWVTCISSATLTIKGIVGIKVDASDGTESDGIKVEWTGVKDGATYTLYRAENSNMDGMKKIYSGKSLTYLDKAGKWFGGIKSGKVYFYQVVASTGEFGDDEGYYDAKIPEIDSLEFPEFWLADTDESSKSKMPFKIKWNDFDEERYEVSELYIMLTGRADSQNFRLSKNKFPSAVHAKAEQLIDTVKLDGWKLPTGFGAYQIEVVIKVLDKVEGKELNDGYFISTGNGKGTVDLFFDKFGMTGGKSNWYVYWPKEGAIDGAYVGGKFEYKPQNFRDSQGKTYGTTYGSCQISLQYSNVRKPLGFPSLVRFTGQEFWIFDLGATTSGYTGNFNGNQVGSTKEGLEFLAAAMAHECRHGELNEETYNHGWVLGDPHNKSPYATAADVLTALRSYGYDSSFPEYYNTAANVKCDLDGDGILDEYEDGKYHDKWNFSKTNPNTHNFPDYPTYGDNEVLARYAELNPTVAIGVNTGKDWAFPGNNNNKDAMGDKKTTWMGKRDGIVNRVFAAFTGSKNATGNAFPNSYNSKSNVVFSNATTQSYGIRDGGSLKSLPNLSDMSDGVVTIGDTVTDNTDNSSTSDGYSKLSLSISVINTGASFPALIRGYLVDDTGNPIAWAESFVDEVSSGTTNVSLDFPSVAIRSIKGGGYRLAAVEVYSNNGDMGIVRCIRTNVGSTQTVYQNNQFAGKAANVLYNTFSETATSKSLDINVIVDAMEDGEYKLQGRLETANGEFVATATTSDWIDRGEKLAKLSFASEDIYLSGRDGPYVLQYISIEDGTSKLDDRLSVYTTANYSHDYFAPSDASLAVNASSFTRLNDEVDGEGSIDGLKFAFDVANLTSDTLVCRIKATLFGTNDLFVCSFDELLPLTNGINTVELFFVGNEVRGSGVGGPYYVGDVLLEPVSGAAERFFPKMDPIDLTTGDFGAFPFEVNGELTFSEDANGDGYRLSVPLEIFRANTVTVTAMLVDANGKFVTMATASRKYTAAGDDVITLAFSELDMLSSERKGPYTVRFVQIESDIPGIDPVRAKVPETAQDVSNTYTRYVDCSSVGGNGYSWATAFSTIQDAIDAADEGDLILVADGVYAPFDTRNKSIEIKSVNGCENTFVDGAGGSRCATLGFEESQTNSVLTGFTLYDGDASASDVLVLWNCGGGVCCGTVRNCCIEGCTAGKGGGAYYGNLEGCVIKRNNAKTYGGGSYYGRRVNCTIVRNTASSGGSGTYYGSTYNSIVLDNSSSSGSEDNYSGGVFAYSLTYPYVAGSGNVSGDVEFRDYFCEDYSLTKHSVCINAGSGEYVTQEFDIAGNKRISGGAVDIGAYELRCSEYKAGYCDFVWDSIDAREGEVVKVSVFGGLDDKACSAQMYLVYNSAVAGDLDLAKGKVDGATPKGGLKFPLKISWEAGDTGEKVVEIPVKTDTTFEGEEFFTLQLADPAGMELGEYRVSRVTIQDKNTKATLADGICNQFLKPSTSGAGKWYAVESWMAEPAEPERSMFVQSPDLQTGKKSTLSFGSVKGAGTLVFDMKFIGESGNGASYVEIYDGTKKIGTLDWSDCYNTWEDWYVSVYGTGNHNISVVLVQGAAADSHVRISNAIWRPSSTSYYTIGISTSPEGAGVVSGAGTYAYGTKINFNATPRPGYTFLGWYRTNGSLFGNKAKMPVTVNGSADFIAFFRKDPYVRALADPASAGKVTGSGPCASGKKVTLKATANKGYVFRGWYDEREKQLTQAASLIVDNSAKPAKPSATTHVISNIVSDVTYFARFITVAEDKANISCTVGDFAFPEGDAPAIDATAPCGVYLYWPVITAGLSQTSAKVAGLPSGLKFNTKTGAIEGAPTTPSKTDKATGDYVPSAVKITVTTAGKSSKVFLVNLTVTPMPVDTVGTFNGFVSPYDDEEKMFYRSMSPASFTLATTAAGKITAKAVSPKGTTSFSANCWDEIENGNYFVWMTARTGEILQLYVDSEPQYWNGPNHVFGFLAGGTYGSDWLYVEAQRSSFLKSGKDYEHPDALALAKAMQGTFKFNAIYRGDGEYELVQSTDKTATLSVTIKNTGAVTLAGTLPGTTYKVSGSSVMRVYPSSGDADVFVCGTSGKTVNVMVILTARLGEDGKISLTGSAWVNTMK